MPKRLVIFIACLLLGACSQVPVQPTAPPHPYPDVAMARDEAPHSADVQFYINFADNRKLDPRPDRWGYAVFGKLVQGMDVVGQIAAVPTGKVGPCDRDAPLTPVVIRKAWVPPKSTD